MALLSSNAEDRGSFKNTVVLKAAVRCPGEAAYEASGPSGQKIADGAQQMGDGIAEVAGAAWNASAPTVSQVGPAAL